MRWIAKALLAAGFLTGIYGVTEPNEMATRSALGLLVAGVLASIYGLLRRVISSSHSGD
jgi:hypothetical protein